MKEQLPLALTPPPVKARASLLRHYHVRSHQRVEEAQEGERRAIRQEDALLAWFRLQPGRRFTPSEVHALAGLPCPVTSIRRAMTGLTRRGELVHHASDRRPGPWGSKESTWGLA